MPIAPKISHSLQGRYAGFVKDSYDRVAYELNLYNVKLATEMSAQGNLAVAGKLAARGKKTQTFQDVSGALRGAFRGTAAPRRYYPSAMWIAWSRNARQGFPLNLGHKAPGPRRNLSRAALAKQQRRTKKNRTIIAEQGRRYVRRGRGASTPARPFVDEAIRAVRGTADGDFARVVDRATAREMPKIRAKARTKYPRREPAGVGNAAPGPGFS